MPPAASAHFSDSACTIKNSICIIFNVNTLHLAGSGSPPGCSGLHGNFSRYILDGGLCYFSRDLSNPGLNQVSDQYSYHWATRRKKEPQWFRVSRFPLCHRDLHHPFSLPLPDAASSENIMNSMPSMSWPAFVGIKPEHIFHSLSSIESVLSSSPSFPSGVRHTLAVRVSLGCQAIHWPVVHWKVYAVCFQGGKSWSKKWWRCIEWNCNRQEKVGKDSLFCTGGNDSQWLLPTCPNWTKHFIVSV